jgi:hypothetical protein
MIYAEDLLKKNLTGYCYYEEYSCYTRTGRNGYEYIAYVVVEDKDEESCLVRRLESVSNKTTQIHKEYLANLIARNPMTTSKDQIKIIDL